MNLTLGIFLGLSLAVNALFIYRFKTTKHKPLESYEVRDLLHDLTSGDALVHIKRIAPTDVFLRSPRGMS